ncbi:hypothetical protein ACMGE6_11380 [Macrococcus equi]|uniref:hypothetical protein n=1 Tax=Macrococcus equi TaxID=3395462 RepID=UPI0039BE06DB
MIEIKKVLSNLYSNDKGYNASMFQEKLGDTLETLNNLDYLDDNSLIYLDGVKDFATGFKCERVIVFQDNTLILVDLEKDEDSIEMYFDLELKKIITKNIRKYDLTPESLVIDFNNIKIELLRKNQLEDKSLLKIMKSIPELY